MDVSKNTGTPKWMVKIMENPIKMDDLGVFPLFFWKHPNGLSNTLEFVKRERFTMQQLQLSNPSGWPPRTFGGTTLTSTLSRLATFKQLRRGTSGRPVEPSKFSDGDGDGRT